MDFFHRAGITGAGIENRNPVPARRKFRLRKERSMEHGSRFTITTKLTVIINCKLSHQKGLFIFTVIETKNGRILRVHAQRRREEHLM